MGLSIKNAEVERLVRALAARRGVSMTEAVHQVLTETLERERAARAGEVQAKVARAMEIIQRTAKLPRLTDLSDDEILGYDENGLPG